MYPKPRFLEELHAIREEMSREADYDVELFAEMVRSGTPPQHGPARNVRGFRTRAPTRRRAARSRKPRETGSRAKGGGGGGVGGCVDTPVFLCPPEADAPRL